MTPRGYRPGARRELALHGTLQPNANIAVGITLAAHWLALWLGLYLIARRPRTAAMVLAGLAFVVVAAYLACTGAQLSPQWTTEGRFLAKWPGVWIPLAPVLLLHAFLSLAERRTSRQRPVLVIAYAAAAVVVLLASTDTLLYRYWSYGGYAVTDAAGAVVRGDFYWLYPLQAAATLSVALIVVARSLRLQTPSSRAIRRHLLAMLLGTALMTAAAFLMFLNVYIGRLPSESLLQLLLILGLLTVAVPMARYPGSLEGQLLRSDMRASLLGTGVLVVVFLVLAVAAGAPMPVIVGLGWLLLAAYLLGDDLRSLADRAFFGAGSRAGRSDLRTVASFAGSSEPLDLTSLSPEHYADVIEYLSAVDRAGHASARLERDGDPRLELLARDEFGVVRQALGLPASWIPSDGVPPAAIRDKVLVDLEPRERQALGLKYLGFSDKEMARLMGVKPGVPRSYLSAGKRKLGLAAGAPLMLFVHLAGVVDSDALPLIVAGEAATSRAAATGAAATSLCAADAAPHVADPLGDEAGAS